MGYDLERFLKAQATDFKNALSELRAGKKKSDWIWYIFPQLEGLGHSGNSKFYGIKGHDEARAYLANPQLFKNLDLALTAVYEQVVLNNVDIEVLMGKKIDKIKIFSCLELFALIATEVDSHNYSDFISKANKVMSIGL